MKSSAETPLKPLSPRDKRLLRECAEAVREALAGSRSTRLEQLFEYLLEKTLAGEVPSEQQINAEAFASEENSCGKDPKVRVYVHRLRKLLDTVFDDPASASLQIPVGEYRLSVEDAADDLPDTEEPEEMEKAPRFGSANWKYLASAMALALVVVALCLLVLFRDRAPLADTALWSPVVETGRPLTIVMGDYYVFNRLDTPGTDPASGPRLVWDRAVPTREDLTILQVLEPERADQLIDYNQHFVTGGTIEAVSTVRNVLSRLPGAGRRSVQLISFSQLTPEQLVSDDIVFVGQFSGIGSLLRDPLLQASGFRFGPDIEGLIDSDSDKRFVADNMVLTDERTPRRDFAYVASLPGPAGNRLLIVAGLGDAGVKQAAELTANAEQLDRLPTATDETGDAFEALFRVRTVKNVNVGASLLLSRSLAVDDIWDSSGDVPAYRPITPDWRE
tara:strand:+ start:26615 stop:27955 length:1341 start_codon:yes stop_codon:yes gene_type:complete